MKIAINTTPLNSLHKDRGIGYYTSHLLDSLKKDESLAVMEFTNISQVKNVDLIHYPWFDFYFHTLAIRRDIKTVVTIHDVIPLVFPDHYPVGLKGKVNLFLQRIALKSVKAVITDSLCSKKDIIKYLKVNSNLVNVVYLAADKDFRVITDNRLLEAKKRFNLPEKFLLYVGDVNWVKNVPNLIEGFKKLLVEFSDFKLVLVGSMFLKKVDDINHPELESIKKINRLIKEYNLEGNIIRPGKLEKKELISFYNLATLFVQPSFYEGFGLPVLEAMSCGTPVICSSRGSLKEVGEEAAIYFDPENIDQFVNLVGEILLSKSLQNKLSNLALKQSAKFSWEKVAQETKAIYKSIND